MRKVLPLLITLACSYQLLSDRLLCKGQYAFDRSDCAAARSFEEEVGIDDAAGAYQECMGWALSDQSDCLAGVDPACRDF